MKTIKEMKTLDRMRETYIPEKAERLDEMVQRYQIRHVYSLGAVFHAGKRRMGHV